jgi:DNA (cytosine-5)-methyltransferase 1
MLSQSSGFKVTANLLITETNTRKVLISFKKSKFKMIKVGSDFSGVGAFNQALIRLRIDYTEVFACDMDKYARQTFIHNYGEPAYYPTNVYDREIPSESLDIYMTSPPCQAFSLAGKRLGKDDKRGILFFNSHEFIQTNKPRYFIFENVKGLLSDDSGKTFSEWVNLLGGKSVNGNATMFPYPDAVPYHIYWKVLNAKDYGVPQNRERVFIIGIRDDADNSFRFPVEEHLTKRLKDVLENEVADKYFLSEKMIDGFTRHNKNHNDKGTGFIFQPKDETEIAACLANAALCATDNTLKIGTWRTHEDGKGFREIEDGNCPTIPARAREDGSGQPVIQIKSATSKGYEEATEGDSINFSFPNSEIRRGRVGKGVAQTLDTGCKQGVIYNNKRLNQTISKHKLPNGEIKMIDSYNQSINDNSICIDTRVNASNNTHLWDGYKIRRLTPRECFRLMDFPDTFTWPVSDSQAYKQAGNSIVVNVLYKILKNLNLK